MKKTLLFSLLFFSLSGLAQHVGIGTTSPEARLHVRTTGWIKSIFENDAGQARGYIGTDNNGTLTLSSNAFWNGSAWAYPNAGNSLYLLLHQPNEAFEFRVRPDGGSQSTAMVVKVNGNVGIGTTNPQQRLEVNGALRLGNSSSNVAGSLRYNNGRFEGHDGSNWKSFEQLPGGSVVTSPIAPNPTLESQGYSFVGGIRDVRTRESETLNLSAGSWLIAGTLYESPGPMLFHTAVWTGTRMLIWGGGDRLSEGPFPYSQTLTQGGWAYDPATNIWSELSATDVPSGRLQHTAVWTGTDMIIWGGRSSNNDGTFTARSGGGKYKLSGDSWTAASGITARYNHTAVWTGTDMIAWGGQSNPTTTLNSGERYNLSTTSAISTTNAPSARIGHTAIWTGSVMVIWGGSNANGSSFFNTGAYFNPATNTWTTMSTTNAPSARTGHTAIWTGTEMIVWGGYDGGVYQNSGARYNPGTNTWTAIANAPIGRRRHTALWTGTEMLIFGGDNGSGSVIQGHRYNPTLNSWQTMTLAPEWAENSGVVGTTAVWTGQVAIYSGGNDETLNNIASSSTIRYYPSAQTVTNQRERSKTIYLYEKQ